MEDGLGNPQIGIKRELEPDSSERDAESPDEGNGLIINSRRESKDLENDCSGDLSIKEEAIDEEASLSPAGSDADRQSGSGGEDGSRELKINRRKRKNPVKLPLQQNNTNISLDIINNHHNNQDVVEEPMASLLSSNTEYLHTQQPPAKRASSGVNLELVQQHHQLQHQLKQCSVMTEQRARNQAINSMPRSTCPICGDKANGLHYGIYTCEACKNFFKRSVASDAAKSYICKYNNSCNVNITEVDGVKMKGPRCQACRYQACLDAGMYHSGVQRTRGGRHGYSPIKQRSGSVEKYPTIATPNISAVMAAAVANTNQRLKDDDTNHLQSFEPADVVSVSMSPSDQSEYAEDNNGSTAHHHSHNFLQKNQIWEQFVSDNVRNEVDLLKSRTNIAETLLTEKTKQLDLVQKQVDMLKQHLLSADQLNKEQAIMIESLKRRLNGGRRENGNGTSNNDRNNGSNSDGMKLPLVFENGGVTITPVVSTTSSAIVTASTGVGGGNNGMGNHNSSSSLGGLGGLHPGGGHRNENKGQNLLSHLLQHREIGNGNKGDMATIEPVRDRSRTNS